MKKQNLVHVKIDYDDLFESKKEILSAEANSIRILQIIEKYHSLRIKEFKTKSKLLRALKSSKAKITKLNRALPKLEAPVILRKQESSSNPVKIPPKKTSLQLQLEEIQKKLKRLEG